MDKITPLDKVDEGIVTSSVLNHLEFIGDFASGDSIYQKLPPGKIKRHELAQLLNKLQNVGYVRCELRVNQSTGKGPYKMYWAITPKGLEILQLAVLNV